MTSRSFQQEEQVFRDTSATLLGNRRTFYNSVPPLNDLEAIKKIGDHKITYREYLNAQSHKTSAEVSEYLTNIIKTHREHQIQYGRLMRTVEKKAIEVRKEKNKEQSLIKPFEEIEEIDNKMTKIFAKRPNIDAKRSALAKERFTQWLQYK